MGAEDTPPAYKTAPPAYDPKADTTHAPEGSEQPPAYTYNAPSSYRIGGKVITEPLVNIPQVKAHLALLRAFKELRKTVQDTSAQVLGLPPVVSDLSPDKRWTWFVGLAVERFQRWLEIVVSFNSNIDAWIERCMPPIDVLMVWHAYLLNPGWHYEDNERLTIFTQLSDYDDMLLAVLLHVGDINTYQATPDRMAAWQKATQTPWNPVDAMTGLSHRYVECPKCEQLNTVQFMTAEGTGYLQHQFAFTCERCKYEVTKEKLAVKKFARDLLVHPLRNVPTLCYPFTALIVFHSGVLFNTIKLKDPQVALQVKDAIERDHLQCHSGSIQGKVVLDQHSSSESPSRWRDQKVKSGDILHIQHLLIPQFTRANRILSAYFDDRPFSIDLIGAVIRQGSFIDKMHNFAWTEPTYFDDPVDEIVLVHSIARYHAFLDLMVSSPSSFFVPTLDIDLAWHTHQMMGKKYANDNLQYVGRFIDHDDKVEENFLSNSFDLTCRAWQERFGIPYMHCGCPLPGDTVGQRLSRLTSRFKSPQPPPAFPSSTPTTNPLNPPRHPDALSATHPSEHNCVSDPNANTHTSEATRAKRIEKMRKRRERDAKLVEKGKMSKREYDRGAEHDLPFLYPVPFFYFPPVVACGAWSMGHYGAGGCAVVSVTFDFVLQNGS
ncbi:hypothetical protein BXZ70DRAFT_888620 [Cristinia sonorae]|uniref:Uncharacterized protein n=1 Tax=Cristinia sonorae TaxID=1940300 RepID=A0A8K0UTQ7_9AGAR|nr:hypothetical protein BXZ70DRAFT_888620 [Cristinia sonorae]